ncbi:MAG: hypothetical protein CMH92_08065 [Oceanicaulis sp.]|jgi:hypothetical protein|nr:hypothetical protein [Oceanicaulis sp.]
MFNLKKYALYFAAFITAFMVLSVALPALNLNWPPVLQVFLKGFLSGLIAMPLHPRFRQRQTTD